ncbi:acyltransferase, partial [Acinetobacter baumannii]|nr:acyltransferase [Acinetobacter baumannii]
MKFRNDIQILRGIAVSLVVLFHLEIVGFSSGFLGVDVFFVVSGFLMAILYNPHQKKEFFIKRAKRLLPSYFIVVLVTLLASIFFILPSEQSQVINQSIYSLFFANNIGFWQQESYFSKSNFNPLLHLWSLGVEIQFYLIIPILAWFFRKSIWFLIFTLIGSLVVCFLIVGISPKTSFFMMPFRLWEFLIGYIAALYFTSSGAPIYKNNIVSILSLICIILIPLLIKVDGSA